MVIRLVPHGDLFLLDSPPQFAVSVLAMGSVYNVCVVLEDTPYRMKQTVDGQDSGGQGGAALPL